jgi:hypothetical protein
MTAAAAASPAAGGGRLSQRDELTAIACLMMLERVNYLLSSGIGLPRAEMTDRLSAIIYAAFQALVRSNPSGGGGESQLG